MKSSLESIVNLFPLLLAVALATSSLAAVTGEDGRQEAVTCIPSELSPCLPAMTSPAAPTVMCCQKLREQQPCFCGYLRNPALAPYISNPRAKQICNSCGVPIPSC